MERNKAEMERSMNEGVTEEEEDQEGIGEDNKRRRALTLSRRKVSGGAGAGSTQQYCCQVDNCGADMSNAKSYHRRHKVCEHHAKAPIVLVAGIQQRFCQQCSRLRNLPGFTSYQNLMKPKGAVAGVWQTTTSVDAKAPMNLMEKAQVEISFYRSFLSVALPSIFCQLLDDNAYYSYLPISIDVYQFETK